MQIIVLVVYTHDHLFLFITNALNSTGLFHVGI